MSRIPYAVYGFQAAAGEVLHYPFDGSHIRFLEADAELEVSVDGGSFEPLPVAVSLQVPEAYSDVRVLNTTGGAVNFRLALSRGVVTDDRLNVTGTIAVSSIASPVSLALSGTSVATKQIVGIASGVIVAANANRKSLTIKALSTNSGIVYINGGVATADHFELKAGDAYTTTTSTAEFQAISDVAGQQLRIIEE